MKSVVMISIRRNWFIYLLLVAITIAVYWNVSSFQFVDYDDGSFVIRNAHIKDGPTPANIAWAMTHWYEANWMPLTWISYMCDHSLSSASRDDETTGGEDPAEYHRTNAILHVLNVLLLFVILGELTGSRWRSFIVAAVFAVHPLHVESVAWVAERKDVLSTFFMFLALWAYLAYARSSDQAGKSRAKERRAPRAGGWPTRAWRYGLMVFFYALALMSKPMVVTLPFLLVLLDLWPLRRLAGWTGDSKLRGESAGRLIAEKIPLFALSAVVCVITVFAQRAGEAIGELRFYPMGERMANAAVSYFTYIERSFWPVSLAYHYPHPHNTIPVVLTAACVLGLALMTAASLLAARRRPYLTVGWLWYVISLMPVIGIIQVGSQGTADRYTYTSLIGLSVAVVWRVGDLLGRSRSGVIALGCISALSLSMLMLMARTQALTWRDNMTLFSHAVRVTRNNAFAELKLGNAYRAMGDSVNAEEHYLKSIRIDPQDSRPHNNLGGLLCEIGDSRGAIREMRIAARLRPKDPVLHFNLGSLLLARGDADGARKEFEAASRLNPTDPQVREALRKVLSEKPTH